jgi:hypothetical protein
VSRGLAHRHVTTTFAIPQSKSGRSLPSDSLHTASREGGGGAPGIEIESGQGMRFAITVLICQTKRVGRCRKRDENPFTEAASPAIAK